MIDPTSRKDSVFAYRPIRVLSILLESTWIGLVLLDVYLFWGMDRVNLPQTVLWFALILLCLGPSLYLHFNYLKNSRDRKLVLTPSAVGLEHGLVTEQILFREIAQIEVIFWGRLSAPWRVYDFFNVTDQAGNTLTIPTHLISYLKFAKLPEVQAALNQINPPVYFRKGFPLIPERTTH